MNPVSEDVQPASTYVSSEYIRHVFEGPAFKSYLEAKGKDKATCIVVLWKGPLFLEHKWKLIEDSKSPMYELMDRIYPAHNGALRIMNASHSSRRNLHLMLGREGWHNF
jgi:hypothetical protein